MELHEAVRTAAFPPSLETPLEQLRERVQTRRARIGVVGLGYVGLPLAVEFAQRGFRVTGIDLEPTKVAHITNGSSYVGDVSSRELAPLVEQGRLRASDDYGLLAEMDVVSICVPTPLSKTRDPDLSYIAAVVDQVRKFLHPGMLVVLESTTYPGTTDEFVLPSLLESGLEVGRDFFLCFSPERVDPGNPRFQTRNIPKVVGGITPACTELGAFVYRQVVETVVPVSSTRVAEMVKLLENTFRSINIGLANEMALLCDRLKINTWEVIDAASTKPFGFMPFYPGPGLGGHCIPVDPLYLSWTARMNGAEARFIELAGQVNRSMPRFVVDKIQRALNDAGRSVKHSRIHLLGVAYKRDVGDMRESPALDVLALLRDLGARLSYSDPHVATLQLGDAVLFSEPVLPSCQEADCVVLLTDHTAFEYEAITEHSRLIVDTRNAFRHCRSENVIRL